MAPWVGGRQHAGSDGEAIRTHARPSPTTVNTCGTSSIQHVCASWPEVRKWQESRLQPFVISFCQHLRPGEGDARVPRWEWSAALGRRGSAREGGSRGLQRLRRATVRPASGWTSDRWPVSLGLFWARTLWCPMLAPQPLPVGHLPLAGPRPSLQGGHSRPAQADYKEADECRIMGLGGGGAASMD